MARPRQALGTHISDPKSLELKSLKGVKATGLQIFSRNGKFYEEKKSQCSLSWRKAYVQKGQSEREQAMCQAGVRVRQLSPWMHLFVLTAVLEHNQHMLTHSRECTVLW